MDTPTKLALGLLGAVVLLGAGGTAVVVGADKHHRLRHGRKQLELFQEMRYAAENGETWSAARIIAQRRKIVAEFRKSRARAPEELLQSLDDELDLLAERLRGPVEWTVATYKPLADGRVEDQRELRVMARNRQEAYRQIRSITAPDRRVEVMAVDGVLLRSDESEG